MQQVVACIVFYFSIKREFEKNDMKCTLKLFYMELKFSSDGAKKEMSKAYSKIIRCALCSKKFINKLRRSQKPTSPLHRKTVSLYQLDFFPQVIALVYVNIDRGIH